VKETATIKKTGCLLLGILLVLPLGGCWNYRGINDTTIITGIAIDRDETGNYRLTYEMVDLTRDIKENGVRPKIVEAEGKTLFDATRNAKKRLVNRLYFSNTQAIVVNKEIAAEEGIFSLIDWFLRDAEFRETVSVVVSQQETARDILLAEGIDEMLVAYEIKKILDKDQVITGSTRDAQLYTVFNELRGEGISFTLPAIHNVMNNRKLTVEANGVAVFKEDKMVGFLTPTETAAFLFAVNEIRGGIIPLSSTGEGPDDASLEISKNKTDISCSYANGQALAGIKTKTEVYLDELHVRENLIDEQAIKKIETAAEKKLKNEITGVIEKVQTEYDSDIFGFGNLIYKKDPGLWKTIRSDWDELFKSMDVRVQCEVSIKNTAALMKN
jgi:spore germination protein KC